MGQQQQQQQHEKKTISSFSVQHRDMQQNENITRIPLFTIHITNNNNSLLSFVKHWNCFLHTTSSLNGNHYLCPAIPIKFITILHDSDNKEKMINAKYEWLFTSKKSNNKNDILYSLVHSSNGEVIEGIELNLIAIRNISLNDKLLLVIILKMIMLKLTRRRNTAQ